MMYREKKLIWTRFQQYSIRCISSRNITYNTKCLFNFVIFRQFLITICTAHVYFTITTPVLIVVLNYIKEILSLTHSNSYHLLWDCKGITELYTKVINLQLIIKDVLYTLYNILYLQEVQYLVFQLYFSILVKPLWFK